MLPRPDPRLLAAVGLAAFHLRRWRADRARALALASARPARLPDLPSHPRVSVLVAAWNEGERLDRHVRSVLGLAYPDLEYVLCAGGPDGTYERARALVGARGTVLRQEAGEGKQRALRRCLAAATGQVVYLTDADCEVDEAALRALLEPIVAGGYDAASGRSRPRPDELRQRPELLALWAPHYVAESALGECSPGLLGRNCALRRDALARAGDFAADVPTGTDYHLARQLERAGRPIAFARWSFVSTAGPESLGAYLRQQSRWLRNHWVHGADDRAARRHALLTWATGALLLLPPWLVPLVGARILWPWLALLAHGSAARTRYVGFVALAEGLPAPPRAFLASPLWVLIDALAWTRSLLDLIDPRRRAAW